MRPGSRFLFAYVLETGVLAVEGPAETVAGDARMVQSYLGAVTG